MTIEDPMAVGAALEASRAQAMVGDDAAARLARLLSDDLYYGHSGGYWDDRSSYLEKVAEGAIRYDVVEPRVRSATWLGQDALLVHGDVLIEAVINGTHRSMTSIYMVVWRREGDGWKLVGHQTALRPAA
jgi:hypothetical protein